MYNFSYVICVDSGIAVHSPSDIYIHVWERHIYMSCVYSIDLQ